MQTHARMNGWMYTSERHQEERLDLMLAGVASSASAGEGGGCQPPRPPLLVQTSEDTAVHNRPKSRLI